MSVAMGIAIYFIIWFVVLFAVLPWGVQTAAEAGEDAVDGQATSAPVRPLLLRKALWTTMIATVFFLLFLANHHYQWIGLYDVAGPFRELKPAD
ncbi:DUF1467 family protein [Parapedomonas caeni]|jgi:predicted secreted protein